MDKKSKIFIVIFVVICLVSLALWLLLSGMDKGTIAVISVDGQEYERVDLSKVREAYDMEISTQYGSNTVHVEPGRISVSQADCPDGVCVRQGSLSTGGVPIVCMPHRLIVQIEGSGIDA